MVNAPKKGTGQLVFAGQCSMGTDCVKSFRLTHNYYTWGRSDHSHFRHKESKVSLRGRMQD